MSITDLTFLFLFLPLVLFLYHISKDKYKNYILIAVSLFFYACGSFKYFGLFLILLFINVLIGTVINKKQGGIKKIVLVLGICINVGALGYYKYYDFIVTNIDNVFHINCTLHNYILPLGISFFTFKAISYLLDVYNDKIDASATEALVYLSFFPQIQSGPLSRYQDMFCDIKNRCTSELFQEGVYRFVIGFNKKILLANNLSKITNEVFALNANLSTAYVWLGSICYSMQLFYDFSGYSDMAIGISNMLGFRCPENFDYPYMTASISEFWRRWHITLGAWFRDYIYIPLGGSRVKSNIRLYFNLFMVWILTGIWHGASWNFVFWGLVYFVLIAFEKTTGFPQKFKSKVTKFVYRLVALLLINLQWVIFRAVDLRQGFDLIKKMFILDNNSISNIRCMFIVKDNWIFIASGIILCFPVVSRLKLLVDKNEKIKNVYGVISSLFIFGLFIWAVSYVVAGQNNPFAYANF